MGFQNTVGRSDNESGNGDDVYGVAGSLAWCTVVAGVSIGNDD